MVEDYGREAVDEIMATRHDTKQWKVFELEEIAEIYKEKVRKILER